MSRTLQTNLFDLRSIWVCFALSIQQLRILLAFDFFKFKKAEFMASGDRVHTKPILTAGIERDQHKFKRYKPGLYDHI